MNSNQILQHAVSGLGIVIIRSVLSINNDTYPNIPNRNHLCTREIVCQGRTTFNIILGQTV